jgi:hypothetical protein
MGAVERIVFRKETTTPAVSKRPGWACPCVRWSRMRSRKPSKPDHEQQRDRYQHGRGRHEDSSGAVHRIGPLTPRTWRTSPSLCSGLGFRYTQPQQHRDNSQNLNHPVGSLPDYEAETVWITLSVGTGCSRCTAPASERKRASEDATRVACDRTIR